MLALATLALLCAGCAAEEATEAGLRDSFAARIESSDFIGDFQRDGDELRFTGPAKSGGTAAWTVRIETSLVEPQEFDQQRPWVGRVTSEWSADGEVVPYLGSMTALPKPFLDRGLGQECWAYWIEAESRWDW